MVPFPVYPWLHVQVKLPGVLVQLALESQLLVVAHSSISMRVKVEVSESTKNTLTIATTECLTILSSCIPDNTCDIPQYKVRGVQTGKDVVVSGRCCICDDLTLSEY